MFTDAKKICFAKYGCFSINKDIKVNYAALPSHPSVIQTKFFLHTRKNPKNADELNLKNISSIMASNFDPSRRTIFIVHGFAHHSQKPWVIKMKNELLKRCWYNVISVDWRKGASYLTMSYLKVSSFNRKIKDLYRYNLYMNRKGATGWGQDSKRGAFPSPTGFVNSG